MTIMRNRLTALVVGGLAVLSLIGCSKPAPPVEVSFVVEGMTCSSCSNAIITTLNGIEGVTDATADHVAGTAGAVIVSPSITADQLAREIEGLGYTVTATATATAPVDG